MAAQIQLTRDNIIEVVAKIEDPIGRNLIIHVINDVTNIDNSQMMLDYLYNLVLLTLGANIMRVKEILELSMAKVTHDIIQKKPDIMAVCTHINKLLPLLGRGASEFIRFNALSSLCALMSDLDNNVNIHNVYKTLMDA